MGAHIIVVASNCEVYNSESCDNSLKKINMLEKAVLSEIKEDISSLKLVFYHQPYKNSGYYILRHQLVKVI